jgi:signal recognition particle subunit SRP54
MFENLVERFDSVFSNLKKTGSIDEKSLDEAMRSIRRALLEADVSLSVVKNFIENVKNKAIGQNIIDSVSPAQMIIKIVNDELTETLGSGKSELNLVGANPKKIMFIGLQGSGKTTSVVKLAKYIKDKNSQNILLVSLDVNRPAAFEQLQILGNKINIKTLSRIDKQNPIEIIKRSEQEALKTKIDFILYDTAGRINIDNNLLQELKIIENEIKPTETLLVLDSLTGQEAMTVAKNFSEIIEITGSILTRVDGDSRGGAALSMKMATGCPIKFMGVGEQVEDLEIFHPERISNRILGMGDIVSLVEKASETIDHQDAENLANKMQKGEFDLNDLLNQIKQMKKMGGISSIMKFIPGLKNMGDIANNQNVNEDSMKQQEAIILSMTSYERKKPKVINGSRKKRIAKGSGTVVSDINKILKQHRKMSDMMKRLSKKGMGNINPMDLSSHIGSGLPNNFFKK